MSLNWHSLKNFFQKYEPKTELFGDIKRNRN